MLDFENPQDADGDNVYVVDVVASDGVNRTVQTVEVTILDDPSDNATSVSVLEGSSFSDVSPNSELGLEPFLSDDIIHDFADQFGALDVFEPVQASLTSELTVADEDHIWTVNSVEIDTELASNETVETAFLDEVNSVAEVDVFEVAAPEGIIDDLWV